MSGEKQLDEQVGDVAGWPPRPSPFHPNKRGIPAPLWLGISPYVIVPDGMGGYLIRPRKPSERVPIGPKGIPLTPQQKKDDPLPKRKPSLSPMIPPQGTPSFPYFYPKDDPRHPEHPDFVPVMPDGSPIPADAPRQPRGPKPPRIPESKNEKQLDEQVGDVNGEFDWGEPPDGWKGPWPPEGPIIIPGDHQQDEEDWPSPLGWPTLILGVLALLSQGYSIWAIAAILGIPLIIVVLIAGGVGNYYERDPIGKPKRLDPSGTPLPYRPHEQHPSPSPNLPLPKP
tara:strand:- start:149 stop:997 length:849 start_codon:yes stop_codon:yes gene_type:complete